MTRTAAVLVAIGALVGSAACATQPRVVSLPIQRNKENPLAKRGTITATLDNSVSTALYSVNVTIGTPGQTVTLQLDTGSSDLWVFGAGSCDKSTSSCSGGTFDPNSSSSLIDLKIPFEIQYETPGSGVNGTYVEDTVVIGGASLNKQTMAVATSAKYVPTGIFGVSFTIDESSEENLHKTYPNAVDTMVSQGLIAAKAYSLYLDDLEASTGSILFGGYDSAKFQGDLIALDIQRDEQSGGYNSMTVAWTSLSITDASGKTGLITPSGFASPAVLDSGTTLTLVPQDIFDTLANYFGAVDTGNGNVNVNCDIAQAQGSVDFGFGGEGGPIIAVPFSELAIPAYLRSGERYTYPDGTPVCSFGITYPQSGQQVLFGDTFLRSAYVVYDLDKLQIGLAQTVFGSSNSDIHEIDSSGLAAAATKSLVQVTPTPYRPVEVSQLITPTAITDPPAFETGKALPGSPTTLAILSQITIPSTLGGAAASTSTGAASAIFVKGDSTLTVAAIVGFMGLLGAGIMIPF